MLENVCCLLVLVFFSILVVGHPNPFRCGAIPMSNYAIKSVGGKILHTIHN